MLFETDLQLLVLIGARADGKKELISVEDGYRESEQSWWELLRDHSSSNTRVPSFHSFRIHSCHTYSLTTSGPALPVILTVQPEKNLSLLAFRAEIH